MRSYGIGIARGDSLDDSDGKWLFQFGAYGTTYVLVVGDRSLDDALETAAAWLAEHAPGHIMEHGSEEHTTLIQEACAEHGIAWEDFDHETHDEIVQEAESDLTYTESGFLTSYEWTVTEHPTREYLLALQESSRPGVERGDVVSLYNPWRWDEYMPRMQGKVLRVRASDSTVLVRLHGGKLVRVESHHLTVIKS
jgi:hypothetical protein